VPKLKQTEPKKPIVRVSVRELVEFVLRTGGLGRESVFTGPRRALEGARAHQRIQKSRPDDYEAEVFVSYDLATPNLTLRVSGRIDGLTRELDQWRIEEIKTLSRPHSGQADPLHWGQAKCYGAMLAKTDPNPPAMFELQLTYLELATGRLNEHREVISREELESFFDAVVREYLAWAEAQAAWEAQRNMSIAALEFPFAVYRPGQRQLAVAVYRAIRDQHQLLAEAPTGIGKTISVLFPAIKALGEGKARKIFYLTARTVGRAVAQETISVLRAKGLHLRAVTLTARDKICFKEADRCEALECPYATSYYDRIKPALRDAFDTAVLDRGAIEALGRRHSLCPFELSLDIARWADLIICDYNYAFDPGSYLRRFFDDDPGEYIFLVDEAHNLPERARDMFSADLDFSRISEDAKVVPSGTAEALRSLHIEASETTMLPSLPEALVAASKDFLAVAEQRLIRNEGGPSHDRLLERYFEITRFMRVAENMDAGYSIILAPHGLRLFCADPTVQLQEALKRADATIFFSATLSPLLYFHEILHAEKKTAQLQLTSPFPQQNLSVLIHCQIDTTLKQRLQTAPDVANAIVAATSQRTGNYLVYFSSFQYLQDVLERVRPLTNAMLLSQSPQMSETERDAFLQTFTRDPARTQIGFATLGGIFGEGIDLVGDRLSGAIIVGVGLPQLCLERDLISQRFAARQLDGYDFAYRFPGMNRVLQAAGRVIRTETDRGFVLLIDRRFAETRYRNLLPPHWSHAQWVRNDAAIRDLSAAFWQSP